MSGREKVNAIVIGAGLAGCAFALRCRALSLSVTVIETKRSPQVQPGETLHPGVEPLFAKLGVLERILKAGFHRHRGIWVEWDGPRVFQSYGEDSSGPWRGFQADRAKLGALLIEAVREAGGKVLHSCQADELIYDHAGTITGLETAEGPIHARWVVDATGRHSWLGRRLRLPFEYHSPSFRLRFGWTNERNDEVSDQPSLKAHERGWNWQAPLGEGRSAWVNLRLPSLKSELPLSHESSTAPQTSRTARGGELQWRFLPACAGPGYFVLGDAAATLDPSSSHGVLRALMSGILAGDLVARVESAGLDPVHATHAYRQWMHAQFTRDTVALRSLWKRHPSEAVRQEMASSF